MSWNKERWQAVTSHLDRVLEMGPDERASYLASLRADDPGLASNLESLLADHDAIRREGFLENPAAPLIASTGARAPGPDDDPSGGGPPGSLESVGPYRVIRRLGEGGMGIVYLAEQSGTIRREIALKVIRPGLDSAKVLARFSAERQILANLSHAGVSKVYDAGATSDGRPYVAMEFVPGSSLTRFCDEHRLGVRERLELFLQVCAAIQHAHQKGVIHRDIKPSNILVSLVDGRPFAKVIDFGIAKALTPHTREEMLLTQTGVTLGTPEYMSPEQAGGTSGDVDTRSDVYALGVVLYELLAGARPFEITDVSRATPLALLEIVRDHDAPKLTARLLGMGESAHEVAANRSTDLKHLVRQLEGELEWITLRALEKSPARRYATAAELASDVEHHLKGDPVLAGPPSTLYRLSKLARRHRVTAAALTVIAVTISVGAVVSTLFLLRAVRAERSSREQLRDSLLNQARTLNNSTELDRRGRALEILGKAAGIRPDVDARNTAIAALAAPGFRVLRRWVPYERGSLAGWPDATLRRYAVGNPDGTISVRSTEDSTELVRLPRISVPADYGRFSPDGAWMAVDYHDHELRLWSLASRTHRLFLKGVRSYWFTPDGARLVATSDDHLYVFDVASGRELSRQGDGPFLDQWPAVHPDGELFLALVFGKDEIQVRRTRDGGVERSLHLPTMGLAARWSADGRSLITVHADYSIRVWDWPAMGAPRLVLRYHRAETTSLATDPSGSLLGTGGWDDQIAFFDLRDGRLLLNQPGTVVHAASDRPAFILVNGDNWSLISFEPAHALETIAVHELEKSPRRVVFSPDGRWLASSGIDGIRLLDRRSREVHRLAESEFVIRAAFNADSSELRAVTSEHLRAWRLGTEPSEWRFRADPVALDAARDRPSKARTVAGISPDGEQWLVVERAPGGAPQRSLFRGVFGSGEAARVDGLDADSSDPEMSPDGKWLAWGNWHGRNAMVESLEPKSAPVELPAEGSAHAGFTPDSARLVVGSSTDIRFYETGSWRVLHTIPRVPTSSIPPGIAFTSDSRLCAVSLVDRVLLLDVRSGEEIATLPAGQHFFTQPAFSPDDRVLAVGSSDHNVLLWDLDTLHLALREIGLDWETGAR